MQQEPIIQIKNLTKTYKTHKRKETITAMLKSIIMREYLTKHAINDITFNIMPGEIIGFIGPNGAGKSTTIKTLTGILYPTSGKVTSIGYEPWTQRKEYVQHIGAVFGQKSQLWFDLPPIDAFHLTKHIYNIPEKEFKKRLNEMIKILDIKEIIERPTRSLSLGERMKCEFIMALLHNPKILFLDEPTIGVDAIAKEEIREFLTRINKLYNTTIILTTHDMDDIEEVCTRIIIIDQGKIIYDGTIKEVKEKYIKWKTVTIEHAEIKNKRLFEKSIKRGNIILNKKYYKIIRYKKKTNIPRTIQQIMKSADVIDLEIHEPRLENIIKEIYIREGKK